MTNRYIKILSLGCAVAFSSAAHATISVGARDNIQIGGFFSQGYVYSKNNNYPTTNQSGTWEFRETALNVSTTLGSRLRVGAQVFAQSLGELGGDKVLLDWAAFDYSFSSALGVRVGRVKYPKGLYGEALDLDVVRPFVFLPMSNYDPILRDFSASFDGGMVYGTLAVGSGSLDYKVFYGDIPMNRDQGVAEFYNDSGLYSLNTGGVGEMNMDSVTGAQLAWNTPVAGLKLVGSYSYFSNMTSSGPFVGYPLATMRTHFQRFPWTTFSAEFVRGNWSFAAEWQRCGGNLTYAAAPVTPVMADSSGWDGWYVSGVRRLGGRFEVGAYHSRQSSRYGTGSRESLQKADTALSVRFDLNDHVLFKLEGHYIDGRYHTFNTLRIPNPSSTLKDSDLLFAAKTTLSF